MFKKNNIVPNILFLLLIIPVIFFFSGCSEKEPQQQILRDAAEYDIKTQEERAQNDESDLHRLSVTPVPQGSPAANDQNQANSAQNNIKQAPAMQIDESKNYSAVLKTSQGDITIDFETSRVPVTVNNFVALAKQNYFNGTVFHRVIKDFMIQGGDPKGDGTGGPGYKFADESLEGKYTRGTVAMANSGPNTNGSQFFIMHKDYELPNQYVIFGHVSSGIEVVDKIANAEVSTGSSGENSKPLAPVKIETVEIAEK